MFKRMQKEVYRNADLAGKIVNADSDMSFAGIVSGNNNGEVWVDSLTLPTIALVWSEYLQCFQWMGSHAGSLLSIDLGELLNITLPEFCKEKGLDYVEYACDLTEWYPVIHNALPQRNVMENWQMIYKQPTELGFTDFSPEMPYGYKLQKIDAGFLHAIANGNTVTNPEFLLDKLIPCWKEPGNYLRLGNGYAAICESEIASVAVTDSRYQDICSIGVETQEKHRRKGLSGILAQMLICELSKQQLKVWWDCMECNTASQKTAQKAGLSFDHKYKVCWYNV